MEAKCYHKKQKIIEMDKMEGQKAAACRIRTLLSRVQVGSLTITLQYNCVKKTAISSYKQYYTFMSLDKHNRNARLHSRKIIFCQFKPAGL